MSVWGDKGRVFRIVNAAGKKLQGQERMGRSPFRRLIDGVGFPGRGVVRASDNKIDRETADDTCVSQKLADLAAS